MDRLGIASGNLEDLSAALASYRDALVLRDQVMAAEPGNVQFRRDYVLTLSMAADALHRLGRKAESQADFRKAFAIVEAYAAAAPENALLQLDLAIGLYRLAYYLDDDPTPRRDRAREVVRRLEGQLTAAQRDFIAQLEQLLVDKPHG
jgi:tetratricopeptide (TPR) repeat protein